MRSEADQTSPLERTLQLQINDQTLRVAVQLQWVDRDELTGLEAWPQQRAPWLRVMPMEGVWGQVPLSLLGTPLLQVLSMPQQHSDANQVLSGQSIAQAERRELNEAIREAQMLQSLSQVPLERAVLAPCWSRYFPHKLYRDVNPAVESVVATIDGALGWWHDALSTLPDSRTALHAQRLSLALLQEGRVSNVLVMAFVHTPGVAPAPQSLGYDTCRIALPQAYGRTLLLHSAYELLKTRPELGLQRIELPVRREEARRIGFKTVHVLDDDRSVIRLSEQQQRIRVAQEVPLDEEAREVEDNEMDVLLRQYTLAMRREGISNARLGEELALRLEDLRVRMQQLGRELDKPF